MTARFLGSRVAGRLFWLFVVAALVPLALSDWLSATAVTEIARDLQQRSQAQATRQIGLQVFDRLGTAKAMLSTLPDVAKTAGDSQAMQLPPASRRMFSRLVHLDENGAPNWSSGSGGDLLDDWQAADHGGVGSAPIALDPEPGSVRATLRILDREGAQPRLLLAVNKSGRLAWIGELNAAYVWEPLQDAAVDSGWRVLDARGRSLTTSGDADLLPAAAADGSTAPDGQLRVRTALFLGPEFGADAWEFIEQRAEPKARWLGVSLAGWLALVALATVLLIALIGQRTIRRMLVPLAQLTEGTKRLSAGAKSTRVAIASDDEFGTLGTAFNEMASRIEAQFDSLEGLAAVDRDVLAGVPIEQLIARVLMQIGRFYPGAACTVCWLSLSETRTLLQISGGAGKPVPLQTSSHPLSDAQSAQFSAITADQVIRAEAADAGMPWCREVRATAATRIALLPLAWDRATKAVLVLGLAEDSRPADLKSAEELRDRLAVAFSARERERVMVHRAVHDSLTGLANRSGLGEFVDRLLVEEGQAVHAALFVDLDHFKDVNDSLGHEAGDAILCEAANRLRTCVESGALVARQGGDEFVLVLPHVDEIQARVTAERIVRELARPFDLSGEQHRFGGSVGVALYPKHGNDKIELLRHADLAMYAAKQAGRGRFQVFDDGLEAAAHERLRIPRELRRDMDLGKLVAYFQARVSPADGRVSSVEALVRWQHPERGLLYPDAFIALAEESSLIEDLGNWMINEACARMSLWRKHHPSLQRVSVNVSPRQLVGGKLPSIVREALLRHDLPPSRLELEVTESLLVEDSGDVYAQLSELRAMGVCIALDDFGTGFSSMAMLRKLPIDVMKIDRAFVKDLGSDDAALAITRSIAELAHSLGLHLVAEGIETEDQAALLRELKCHEFQGYLYSKPLPPGDFSLLCEAHEPRNRAIHS